MSDEQQKKLREIAQKLGTTVEELLKMGPPDYIIESYEKDNLQLLNG